MAEVNGSTEKKRARRFTWRTGVAVALATTLLCIAALEVGLRIVRLHQAPVTLAELEERRERFRGGDVRLGHLIMPSDDPDIVYELIPNLDVVWRDIVTSRATHVRTNSYGWRDDEWTSPKPAGQVRIAVLGDSTSFGWFIEREDNHPECLQWALNRVAGEDVVEVMNFSVPGYNSAMEKEVLRARALSHQPDIVVLQFEINDMHLPNFMKLPENVWRLDRLYLWDCLRSLHPRWKKTRKAEALPELVGLDALELVENEDGERRFQLDPDRIPPEHRDMAGPENCRRHIAEIGRICRDQGLPAVMLLNPILPDFYGEGQSTATDPQYVHYVETAREAGFIIADPTPDIQEFLATHHLTSRDLFADPASDDSHPSPPRSALMARRLALTLFEHGLLGPPQFESSDAQRAADRLAERADREWIELKRATMPKLADTATTVLPRLESADESILLEGWYGREWDPGGVPFRWTQGRAAMRLPPGTQRIVVEIGTDRPRNLGPEYQVLYVNDKQVDYEFRRRNGRAWFDVPVPDAARGDAEEPVELRLRCLAPIVIGPGEGRELGLAVYRVLVETRSDTE